MLGIDGVDLLFADLRVEQQMTARHHRFLVGEGELGAGLQRGDGGFQTDGSGDAVEHHVGTRTGQSDHSVGSGLNVGAGRAGLIERFA